MLFWACTITAGHLWKRLIRPYRQPPLCLARLLCKRTSEAGKRRIADWVLNCPECCQCKAFIKPLRALCSTPNDLMCGLGFKVVYAAFHTKNVNIEVENAFARVSSMAAATRGRSDRSSSLFAKHLLSELKSIHRNAVQRETKQSVTFVRSDQLPGPPITDDTLDDQRCTLPPIYCF